MAPRGPSDLSVQSRGDVNGEGGGRTKKLVDLQALRRYWRDRVQAANVSRCLDQADYWEWRGGSSLFFWRWSTFLREARDGFPIPVRGRLPSYKRPQRKLKPDVALRLAEKIHGQRRKGYIQPLSSGGCPASNVDYFPVPKAE